MAKTPDGKNTSGRGQRELTVQVKTARGRKPSSTRWLQRQLNDPYVKRAQVEGYRGRAAFKIMEVDDKFRFLVPGARIVDLGCAPGGWCQVVLPLVGRRGKVFALDVLAMEPLPGVHFIQGDFTEDEPLHALEAALEGAKADLVLSDMAPNISGMAVVDQAKAMYLAELALEFCESRLKPGGDFVVKLFQGTDFDRFVRQVRNRFDKVQIVKPKASRPRSREVYLLARGFGVE